MAATHRHSPAVIPHRRYPSLSDDGQPFFPRSRPPRRSATESATATSASEGNRSRIPYVRVFSLLAIIAIIAALVANP